MCVIQSLLTFNFDDSEIFGGAALLISGCAAVGPLNLERWHQNGLFHIFNIVCLL